MGHPLAGAATLLYPERIFNGICFDEEPQLTTLSTALDLAFGVWEVTQQAPALGFWSASW